MFTYKEALASASIALMRSTEIEKTADILSQSSILRLPSELRIKIFSHLLGGHVIHVGGTGNQPYAEGHLPDGRSCACTARTTDEEVFASYTLQGKAMKGWLCEDRFSARHRDCFRYPVSRRLQLNILLTCKLFYREGIGLVFKQNIFTLARPSSLAPFLARLSFAQIQLIQTIRVYSSESVSTWLIPVKDLANINHLAGLRCLQVFLQIKPYAVDQYFDVDPEDRAHSQFASLGMFKGPSLNEVDVMIVTPEWKNVDADELSEATVEGVAKWQGEIRDILL